MAMLLVLLPLSLFADEHFAVWSWNTDDPEVTAYRYQLNGQDPENWTVVSADVSQYMYYIEDTTQEYTLYVQSTYDGENWSESGKSVFAAIEAPEQPVAEEAAVVEVVAEEPVAEAKTPVEKSGRWFVTDRLGFNVTASSWKAKDLSQESLAASDIGHDARFAIMDKISAGYQFNSWFRLGLTTGFAYQFNTYSGRSGYMYIPLTIDTDFRLGAIGPVDFWAQLSLGGYDRIVGNKFQLGPMAALSLYAEYAVNDNLLIGAGTGLTSFYTIYNGGKGLEILLESNPVYLTCTYMF